MRLALATAFFLASCGRPPATRDQFPVGIYGVRSPDQLQALRNAGIDTIYAEAPAGPPLSALAAEARRQEIRMLVGPDYLQTRPSNSLRDWPVIAWYVKDEPEIAGLTPADVSALTENVKRWDPARPTAVCIGSGKAAAGYGAIPDIVLLNWYPVPHLPLDSFSDQLDEAAKHIAKNKPIWAVIQAFDWRDYAQRHPDRPRIGRFPTHVEIRFLAYSAILHGARGVFFYTLDKPGGESLLHFPEQWHAVAHVARELKQLQRILSEGESVNLPFEENVLGLEARAWRFRGRDYIMLTNRRSKSLAPVPKELLTSRWRPLFESRRHVKENLLLINEEAFLQPYRVMVLESRLSL